MAGIFGLRPEDGQTFLDALESYLRARRLLLVLDNCEQVLPVAALVDRLLRAAPGLKVLATSRAPLHLYGEVEYAVPPLALPARDAAGHFSAGTAGPSGLDLATALSQYEAVRLFIARAQAARTGFAVTNETAPAVAEICWRLDGLPLAIELAAARVKLFPPQALLARLDRRLAVLTGGAGNLPARQQTLRAAIAWSYDLLSAGEQQLFRRIAVFQGGATLEAIAAVCEVARPAADDVLDGVAALVDHSLLQQRDGRDGAPRFGMLATIQEYALEQLASNCEETALRDAHLAYFTALGEEGGPALKGHEQLVWLPRLEDERENLRAALAWACERAAVSSEAGARGLQLTGALYQFWFNHSAFAEASAILETLRTAGAVAPPALHARALNLAGEAARDSGDFATAERHYEESWALYAQLRDRGGMAWNRECQALLQWQQGDWATARTLVEPTVGELMAAGATWEAGWAVLVLTLIAMDADDTLGGKVYAEQAAGLFQQAGDRFGLSAAMIWLGVLRQRAGDYPAARRYHERSLELCEQVRDSSNAASALGNLGTVALLEGDYVTARSWLTESLDLSRETPHPKQIGVALAGLGAVGVARAGARPAALSAPVRALAAAAAYLAFPPLDAGPRRPRAERRRHRRRPRRSR